MTVTTTAVRETKAGDGVTISWSFSTFVALDPSHVQVKLRDELLGTITALVYGVDYSVALTGTARPAAGAITLLGAHAASPPDSDTEVEIYRETPRTQATPFDPRQAFSSGLPEAVLDRQILILQEAIDYAFRALVLDAGDEPASLDPLPDKITRAGKHLGFDADGQPVALDAPAGTTAVSVYMAALLTSASEAALKAAMNAEAGVDFAGIASNNTLTGTQTYSGVATFNASHRATKDVRKSGFVSTSTLGADQNDFAPTGHADASVLIFNLSASINITGIAGGAVGRELWLFNNSATHAVTLLNENASSVAGNRFDIGNAAANFVIPAKGAVRLWYSAAARWNVHGVQTRAPVSVAAVTLSGTTGTTFSSLPADIDWIDILVAGWSLDDTDNYLVQIGRAAGLVTTGYASQSGASIASTAGFVIANGNAATDVAYGEIRLRRVPGTNTWICSHSIGHVTDTCVTGAGLLTLDAALDRVAILDTGGDNYDAGSAALRYGWY